MIEFLDGFRYTYYCNDSNNNCDSTYWNSLDTNDALPTRNPYTVDDSTLSIDLHFGTIATYTMGFRCDDQVVDFFYDEDDWVEGLHSTSFRVGLDINDCGNQQEVAFTKQDSADWTLPENQDRITESVWITRKHNQNIFNFAQEDGYSGPNGSPLGTLWANSSTENAQSSDFSSFLIMHGGDPQSLINDTISLYLPDYERYFDLVFLSFSGGNSGGGFSYSREEVFPTHLGAETIEGRWLWGYGFATVASTMYELIDGTMYTYYCAQDSVAACDATYWNSLDISDAIPNPDSYTFINDTLTIDEGSGALVNFECNGNIALFGNNTSSYWWRVGLDTSECEEFQLALPITAYNPNTFRLNQNYPNPFNPITNLSYELSADSFVTISVYDLLGNVVKNLVSEYQKSGVKSVQWDATNDHGHSVAAGVYLYRIESGPFKNTKKMILLK